MEFEMFTENSSIIKVLGVGGGGCNAVNYMYEQGIPGVNFGVCNTDKQDLLKSPVPTKIQMGTNLLEGLGAGADPEEGRRAALEAEEEIRMYLSNNTKMVFVTAGMGGGTGTGGAPIVSKIAKELGILTVGIVTIPFTNEGKPKRDKAERGIQNMKENVDALIVVSNNKLYDIFPDLDIDEAFSKADDILTTAAKGITEIITKPGKINVDFNDVKRVMSNSGVAIIGIGKGSGENRAQTAIHEAMNSPLLEDADIFGAKGVVLYITYGNGIKMRELDLITESIQEQTQTDCEIIWGVCKDDSLDDEIAITLVATGFQSGESSKERKQVQKLKEEKVVYTLQKEVEAAPIEKKIEPTTEVTPSDLKETIGVIECSQSNYTSFINEKTDETNVDSDDLSIPSLEEIETETKENEVEFEINLNSPQFDIQLVDKPRNQFVNEMDEAAKSSSATDKQFTLFEREDNHSNIEIEDKQDLERDLIKKRITLDMEKHQISLYELEREPAYKRYGLDLDGTISSDESNFSNYMIYNNSTDPTKIEIRPNAIKDITLD
ncbi:MAG TPA: cell division protein FtsZ [Chitinophagales bacterium]|jgi:cell division protein FtsZ|nr:cell division protein FtsZ [Chitinophagales bacterium]MBP6154411.1 cell division protein FtsZ [Chitinophagales bacterium]HQV77973.1 cell division protein FtsZ [Chitinophagales bacterium]HQW78695.1 cell division protein FtsZ [Chitinophagales bacterium]HRB18507.1 cell division protein FtsZ [Chitinophagales bacterium]